MRHLLTLSDLSADEMNELLDLAVELKTKFAAGTREPLLPSRVLGLLFSKPSLRTRVSFEAAMTHLGGTSLYLGQDVGWGKREPISDFGRVLSQYVDAIVCRTFEHGSLVELASYCDCPVINGLTDSSHPCQALADLLTLREAKGPLKGLSVTFVGDGNNVSRSLALACKMAGTNFTLAAPAGYEFAPEFLQQLADLPGDSRVSIVNDPHAAVKDADAVYTDVWSSMGQEAEKAKRERDFADYQVNSQLMASAANEAIFLHCLPAKRGLEVTDEVMESPGSRIVQQAANRMHAQKAVLAWLLK